MADFVDTSYKYGNAYSQKTTKAMSKLEAELLSIVKGIDKGGMKYLVAQRNPIRKLLLSIAKTLYNTSTAGAFDSAFKESAKLFQSVGLVNIKMEPDDLSVLKAIKQNSFAQLAGQAQIDASEIWSKLSNYAVTGNFKGLKKNLLQNLDKLKIKKYGTTIVNTSIDAFYRTTNGIRAVRSGVEKFEYLGAPPQRQFCVQHYAKIYTMAEINLMDNGQIGDVFYYGGGYNCRHYWSPVVEGL